MTASTPLWKSMGDGMVKQIVTEEELTYESALALFNAAKQNRVNEGFIHSIARGCFHKEPNGYRLSKLELATA